VFFGEREVFFKFRYLGLEVIDNILSYPYSPEYRFERLKYELSGFCSKRVDGKNRIVYQVLDDKIVVIVVSVLGHYED